jgi:VWFA-related protein
MPHAPRFPSARRIPAFVPLAVAVLSLLFTPRALAQTPSQQDTPSKPPPPSPQAPLSSANSGEEVSTRDAPTTFKVRVNLVLVHVVVRDAQGHVVTNLKKEDFQLTDSRKPQVITTFSLETPESHKFATATAPPNAQPPAEAPEDSAAIATLPQRFVALVFDDTNMQMQDTTVIRDAATRLFGALAPSDRVGIYTTSGQLTQEFTEDRGLLNKALLGIVPRPTVGAPGIHDCPEVSLHQADLIENEHDTQALGVATEEALQCAFGGDQRMMSQAQSLAQTASTRALAAGESQISYVYRHLEEAMRRLSAMPGHRIMVLVSPGFVVSRFAETSSTLIDRANRANVVINTIDARGLYAPDLLGDIADPPRDSFRSAGYKSTYRIQGQAQQGDVLAQFADGTGGTFFHNRNDLDQGLREAVAAPAASYLLGFSPQNLKIDGRYHTLSVSLTNKQLKYSIQARHGYFAPRTITDPAEAAKEEIQEALFSQDELRDLPVDLQTQFFRTDQTQARLAVLTHVHLKGIRFRKAAGRNFDDLTVATAIFDENGNFVAGGEKIVEMRLRDQTVERLATSGFTVKSSFDIKPGTYLVRLVVRDAEGAQMAARNGAVNIPY